MNIRVITLAAVAFLSACGQDEPPKERTKSIGGQIGDSYKGMLDSAKQGVGNANDRMQKTDQSVGERQ